MTRPAADLVAQALELIERDDLTLEQCPVYFGEAWAAISPAVKLALQVNQASHPPVISARPYQPLDLSASWQDLQSKLDLTPSAIRSAANRLET